MNCIEVSDDSAKELVCYPKPSEPYCTALIGELVSVGVERVCSLGRYRLPSGYSILGSGWAGNVVAMLWRGRLVAVKVRKPGSRRVSMLKEGFLAGIAGAYGIGPEVYMYTRDFIIMRLVQGPRLGEYRPRERWMLRLTLRRLVFKTYLLDRLRIDHGELVRPEGQVLVENGEPLIIDYDSASCRRRPRNLTRLLTGLWRLRLIKVELSRLSTVLRVYRLNPNLRLVELITSILGL